MGDIQLESVHYDRSVVNTGDISRLQNVFAKARFGEDITIGFIGGSVTEGAWASKPDNKWGNRVAAWWRNEFPFVKKWSLVNAGIGATGTNIGVHRISKHLLKYDPDVVLVEFTVNDLIIDNNDIEKTYEGLIRQILNHPSKPAIIALCIMEDKGRNKQDIHLPINKHYGIPVISYRDAIWPDIESGAIKWDEIAQDYVHPNDTGHKICSELLCNYMEKQLSKMAGKDTFTATRKLPDPLYSGIYENAVIHDYTSLEPVINNGWKKTGKKTPFGYSWSSKVPGSKLEFEVDAAAISLIVRHIHGNVGIVTATIDDSNSIEVDSWFAQDWGTPHLFHKIIEENESVKRRLTIELTDKNSPQSVGHYFEISGICIAGYN